MRTRFIPLALLSCLSLSGCGDDAPVEDLGAMQLRIAVGDHQIDSIHYEIARPGFPSISGDADVSTAATVLIHIGGIPEGTGYTVTLSADTTGGEQACDGTSDPFAVLADATTGVDVALNCKDIGGSTLGSIDLDVQLNECPAIESIVATPLEAPVGATISLSSAATDFEGSALSYSWVADGAEFSSASSAEYGCLAIGSHVVDLMVSDDACEAVESITVSCVP